MKKLATILFALLLAGSIVAPISNYIHNSSGNKVADVPAPPNPPGVLVADVPAPPNPPGMTV